MHLFRNRSAAHYNSSNILRRWKGNEKKHKKNREKQNKFITTFCQRNYIGDMVPGTNIRRTCNPQPKDTNQSVISDTCNMQWWSPRGHGLGLEAPRGHFMKSLALALVLDFKSLTIGCHIITLLIVIIQWNKIRELEQNTFAFTLLLSWFKFKFYYNIIINTHC